MRRYWHYILLFAMTLSVGCEKDTPATAAPKKPWTWESEKAPYTLKLGGAWKRDDPDVLNEFADLAVTHDSDLFFIVIPQRLPDIAGVERPDALDLKRAGVTLMEAQIDELEIQKQGPVRVDQRQGQSVVARGIVDKQQVKYVTTYLTEGEWGFQLVGWSPIERRRELMVRIDELLAGWSFKAAKNPEDATDIQADAGVTNADAGEQP